MTSVVLVDSGGTVVEYVTAEEDLQQVCCTPTQGERTAAQQEARVPPSFCLSYCDKHLARFLLLPSGGWRV